MNSSPQHGLFDGFEGYRTPTNEDISDVLRGGLVTLDTNVLLDLYRYTSTARSDLLNVLNSISDNLWVSNQTVKEFWRNRESVLNDPRDTKKTISSMRNISQKATEELNQWFNRVSLPNAKQEYMSRVLAEGFESVIASIEEFKEDPAIQSSDTSQDDVVSRLEQLLRGKVGPSLSEDDYLKAVAEGKRRVENQEPPGFKDKSKADVHRSGDYLVWEQLLQRASELSSDVLFVTDENHDDWWRKENGEKRGPRIELVDEMHNRCGCRFFMLQPSQLLEYASSLLSIDVHEESVETATRIASSHAPQVGWSRQTVAMLISQLKREAPDQLSALQFAAINSGSISREEVYTVCEYSPDRSLRGFTRPINRITNRLKTTELLGSDSETPFYAVYDEDSLNPGWASKFVIAPRVFEIMNDAEDVFCSSDHSEDDRDE